MAYESFPKDPDAILDYAFDWTDWLEDGETIVTYDVEVPTGLTKGIVSELSGKVVVWLEDGEPNETYYIICEVITSEGRKEHRTAEIHVKQR